MENVIFDPALFLWNEEDFKTRGHIYWDLVNDLMVLFDVLAFKKPHIIARANYTSLIINSFPYSMMNANNKDFRDFSKSVYQFFGKLNESLIEYDEQDIQNLNPDFRQREHLSEDIISEFSSSLLQGLEFINTTGFITNEVIMPGPCNSLYIESLVKNGNMQVLFSSSCYISYRDKDQRYYELYAKHHPIVGYRSKLPKELTNQDLQNLLDVATPLNSDRYLAVFSTKANKFIAFRRHCPRRYHGYPKPKEELMLEGYDITMIPIL